MEDIKLPPHDENAEVSVLGGVLLDNKQFPTVESIISSSDFHKSTHRKIFKAMQELFEDDNPIDLLTLKDTLEKQGSLDSYGGVGYVMSLADGVPTAANIAYYCKIVKEKAVGREILAFSNSLITSVYDGEDITDVVEVMKESAFGIDLSKTNVPIHTMKDVIKQSFAQIEASHTNPGTVSGVPYGFTALDRLTSGAQEGDLIIIAGRPGMGKSLFAGEIINRAAKSGYPSGLFSAEMLAAQYGKRTLSAQARVNHSKTRTGNIDDGDWSKLVAAAGELSSRDIYIVDKEKLALKEIVATAELLKRKHGMKAMVVDYLQLIRGKNIKGQSREQEVSQISYEMKNLAKRLEVPVFLLSQLNREVEKRPDKRPILSDLRESGSIEQDADVVIMLYRPEEYFTDKDIDKLYPGWGSSKPSTIKDLMECIITKGRDIKTGMVFLKSEMKYLSISDYTALGI
jgi:replicative DNA helicase